jgi:ribosome-associated translation inhibitor RaiA
MNTSKDEASVEGALRLGGGLEPSERDTIVTEFASLDSRLRSFDSGSVELLLTVKERDTPSQRTTLEAQIAGQKRLVATSSEQMLNRALHEVRDDLVRQITDAKNRTEPRNNRHLRSTES